MRGSVKNEKKKGLTGGEKKLGPGGGGHYPNHMHQIIEREICNLRSASNYGLSCKRQELRVNSTVFLFTAKRWPKVCRMHYICRIKHWQC